MLLVKNSTKGDKESGYIIDRNLEEEKSEYVKTINNGYENGFIFNHKARYNNDRDIEIFQECFLVISQIVLEL